jgi:hypothetical protein
MIPKNIRKNACFRTGWNHRGAGYRMPGGVAPGGIRGGVKGAGEKITQEYRLTIR